MSLDLFDPNSEWFAECLMHTKANVGENGSWAWLMVCAARQVVEKIHEKKIETNEAFEAKLVGFAWKIVVVLWKEREEKEDEKDTLFFLSKNQNGLIMLHLLINKEWKNRWSTWTLHDNGANLLALLIENHSFQFPGPSKLLCEQTLREAFQQKWKVTQHWSHILRFAKSKMNIGSEHAKAHLIETMQATFETMAEIDPECVQASDIELIMVGVRDFSDVLLSPRIRRFSLISHIPISSAELSQNTSRCCIQ